MTTESMQASTEAFLLVCPHCNTTNRIPSERMSQSPNCGKCRESILTSKPQILIDSTVHKVIQKNGILTIVDFWASWCQPCLMMAPQFAQTAEILPQVVFAKLQTDKYEHVSQAYNIRSLPTMVAFKNGKEIARQSGAMPAAQITQWVKSLM